MEARSDEQGRTAAPVVDVNASRSLLDALPDALCVVSAQGRVVFCNVAWKAQHTASPAVPDTPLPPGPGDALHIERLFAAGEQDMLRITEGVHAVLTAETDSFSIEYTSLNGAGAASALHPARWLLLTATPVVVDGARAALLAQQDISERKAAQQKQAQFEAIFQELQDVLLLVDPQDGTITMVNHAVHRLLGYEPEELLGKHVSLLFPPEKPRPDQEILQHLRIHSGVFEAQEFLSARGSVVLLDLMATSIAWGTEQAALLTLHDATERRQTELLEEQASSELERLVAERTGELQLFQTLVEHAPDGIVVANQDNYITYANQAFLDMMGYGDDITDITIADLYNDEPERITEFIRQRDQQGNWYGVLTYRRKDGSTFPGQLSALRLYDKGGNPIVKMGIVRDITEQRRIEAALRESRSLLQAVLDYSPAAIYVKDLQGRLLLVNQQYATILKLERDQIIGKTNADLFPAEIARTWQQTDEQIIASGQAMSKEDVVPLDDGTHTYLSYLFPISDPEGKLYAIGGIATDITERKHAEEALQVSEARQNAFFAAAPVGMILLDENLYYRKINQTAAEMNGLPIEAHLGKTIPEVLPELADLAVNYERVLVTGEPLNSAEVSGCTPAQPGILRYWQLSIFPVPGYMNTPDNVGAIFVEITEHKRAEKALRMSEARLHHLLHSSPVIIFSSKASGDYGATFVSDNILLVLGYEPHEFTEQSDFWASHIHPDDAPTVFANLSPLFEHGEHQHEYRFLHRDGTYRWMQNNLRLIRDETGTPLEIIGSLHDITERKQAAAELQQAYNELERRVNERTAELRQSNEALQKEIAERWRAEEAVRQSEEQLRRVVQHMPVLLDAFDEQGNIVVWNEECERVTGYSAEEVINNPRAMVLFYPDPDYRARVLTEWLEKGHNYRDWEWNITAKDGTIKTIAWSNISQYFPIPGWTSWGIGVDITRRKQIEAQLQTEQASLARRVAERTADLSVANAELARAVRTKDEFLANMSHELRTPLNAILGLSEALQEDVYGTLTPRQRSSMKTIEESGRHLLELINDILDLSKIEAGKADLQIKVMMVEDVCQASLKLMKQAASKKRIAIAENLDENVTVLYADERRIKQILVNLLSNAVKFTPEHGMVGLEVNGNAEDQVVHFIVWDTGIGIEPEKMERLFKAFVQIDAGLNRQHEGTGLGLALVARLAEMHGGSVSVESDVGKGSRFTVSLPWLSPPSEQEEQAEQAALLGDDASDFTPTLSPGMLQRALLIEDSPTAAEQIIRYLKELNIETSTIVQGDDVITQVMAVQPDIIVLDILLPNISGWDILTMLKNAPRTHHIPVVIISNLDDRPRGISLGAAAYLVKPVSRQQVHTALASIVVPDHPPPAKALVMLPEKTPEPHAPLILLAEDNEDSSMMLSEYLMTRGYRVVIARNGGEAIEQAREELPALIIMDIQMPGMDGLEAIRRIRADSELQNISIIALTALAMPGDRERCLKAGANDYISKPVSLKNLAQMIQNLREH